MEKLGLNTKICNVTWYPVEVFKDGTDTSDFKTVESMMYSDIMEFCAIRDEKRVHFTKEVHYYASTFEYGKSISTVM